MSCHHTHGPRTDSPISYAQNYYFDALQQIRPREYQNAGVRVVDVDEASLRALGQCYDVQLATSFLDMPVVLGTARTTDIADTSAVPIAEIVEFGDDLVSTLPPLGASTATIPVLRHAATGIIDAVGVGGMELIALVLLGLFVDDSPKKTTRLRLNT